ncbi:hypothetical protein PENSPDRAFT_688712 [Peniophora sp. CONT]|nr:hypothetical protein PENSPDRAFT_688712 [Peniophora sp. CONT]
MPPEECLDSINLFQRIIVEFIRTFPTDGDAGPLHVPIPEHSHPPLKRWPDDYSMSEIVKGFDNMDTLLAATPTLTQRAAFKRVFGSMWSLKSPMFVMCGDAQTLKLKTCLSPWGVPSQHYGRDSCGISKATNLTRLLMTHVGTFRHLHL